MINVATVEVSITRQQFRAAVHKILTAANFASYPKQAQQAINRLFESTDLELFGPDSADLDEEAASPQESGRDTNPEPTESVTVDALVSHFLQLVTLNWPKIAEGSMFPESQLQPLADALGGMLTSILQGIDLGGGGPVEAAPDRANVMPHKAPNPNFALPAKEARQYA